MFGKIVRGFAEKIKRAPIKTILIACSGLIVFAYIYAYASPRHATFSYAGETCIRELTFLPNQQRTVDSLGFNIEHKGLVGAALATETCFTPTTAPAEGRAELASAPFGWVVFRSHYTLTVDAAPHVMGSATTTPIAITKPVVFSIDKPDKVYSYSIENGDTSQQCATHATNLECNVDELGLAQGETHTVALTRSFGGRDSTKVTDATVSILSATSVTDSSVKEGQLLYDKPTSFSFTVDKPLVSAKAKLELVDGETTTAVQTTTVVNDTAVTITANADLEREKQFRLTLTNAEATDGSMLNQPYVINFATSGGPIVSGVNIGTSGVDPNARVIVTFDQAIADSVDITKFAHISGVDATISKQGSQVIFAIKSAPRCVAFTLSIDKGITSGTNGLSSTRGWSYTSRINCRATAVIGYSVKGRPITAYYYGSGATTILFTGGIHGSEPSGYSTMLAWANYLDVHAPSIPADKQVVIVPNTNPDGIAANSRYNANGVNLDRNYATADWKTDIDTSSGTLPGGGGSAPMSEPETQALGALTLHLNPRLEVSFHASGRLVGANDIADSRAIGSLYAGTVGYSTMFGGSAEEIMGYSFSGQYEDYIGQKLGKPAILIELPSYSGNYLSSQLSALWKMVEL